MIKRILAASDIQGVAVCQIGHAAVCLDNIHNGSCVVGAQEGQIAQLTEVNLDSYKLILTSILRSNNLCKGIYIIYACELVNIKAWILHDNVTKQTNHSTGPRNCYKLWFEHNKKKRSTRNKCSTYHCPKLICKE